MPTYDFECRKCGHVFDEFYQLVSKAPRTRKCPECGGRCDRLIGSGFRVTLEGPERYKKLLQRIPDTPDNRKRAEDGLI